jgi:N12 class adenine-specific DNA methylase
MNKHNCLELISHAHFKEDLLVVINKLEECICKQSKHDCFETAEAYNSLEVQEAITKKVLLLCC